MLPRDNFIWQRLLANADHGPFCPRAVCLPIFPAPTPLQPLFLSYGLIFCQDTRSSPPSSAGDSRCIVQTFGKRVYTRSREWPQPCPSIKQGGIAGPFNCRENGRECCLHFREVRTVQSSCHSGFLIKTRRGSREKMFCEGTVLSM